MFPMHLMMLLSSWLASLTVSVAFCPSTVLTHVAATRGGGASLSSTTTDARHPAAAGSANGLIAAHREDLEARIAEAIADKRGLEGDVATDGVYISLDDLESELDFHQQQQLEEDGGEGRRSGGGGGGGIGGPFSELLCSALEQQHMVTITLGRDSPLPRLWSALQHFFALASSADKMAAMGSLQEGHGFGYVNLEGNEFVETMMMYPQRLLPLAARMSELVPELPQAVTEARLEMARVAKCVVSIAALQAGLEPATLLRLMDPADGSLDENAESVLRLCCYRSNSSSSGTEGSAAAATSPAGNGGGGAAAADGRDEGEEEGKRNRKVTSVAFGAHTDTTFVTMVPCSSVAGLEIHGASLTAGSAESSEKGSSTSNTKESSGSHMGSSSSGSGGGEKHWIRPEAAAAAQRGPSVVVMSGELLQVFTAGRMRAAVHRVVHTSSVQSRMSAPLLVRGRMDTLLRSSSSSSSSPEPLSASSNNTAAAVDLSAMAVEGWTVKAVHESLNASLKKG